MQITNIALIIAGLIAVAVFVMRKPTLSSSPRGINTINIPGDDSTGRLLVPSGGLDIIGSSSQKGQFLNAKCDCTGGQCCWTAQVISPRYQNEPMTIGPYCSTSKNCDEVKAKFLGQNTVGLNTDSYLARLTVA